jgi:hypothetical protein
MNKWNLNKCKECEKEHLCNIELRGEVMEKDLKNVYFLYDQVGQGEADHTGFYSAKDVIEKASWFNVELDTWKSEEDKKIFLTDYSSEKALEYAITDLEAYQTIVKLH